MTSVESLLKGCNRTGRDQIEHGLMGAYTTATQKVCQRLQEPPCYPTNAGGLDIAPTPLMPSALILALLKAINSQGVNLIFSSCWSAAYAVSPQLHSARTWKQTGPCDDPLTCGTAVHWQLLIGLHCMNSVKTAKQTRNAVLSVNFKTWVLKHLFKMSDSEFANFTLADFLYAHCIWRN